MIKKKLEICVLFKQNIQDIFVKILIHLCVVSQKVKKKVLIVVVSLTVFYPPFMIVRPLRVIPALNLSSVYCSPLVDFL
jgi:hypothetical protein